VVIAFGLIALSSIDTNISGDGIQNKPQSKRILNNAIQKLSIVAISGMIATFSWFKLRAL
jgi:amino acid permease